MDSNESFFIVRQAAGFFRQMQPVDKVAHSSPIGLYNGLYYKSGRKAGVSDNSEGS